jgi:hypothetical protein
LASGHVGRNGRLYFHVTTGRGGRGNGSGRGGYSKTRIAGARIGRRRGRHGDNLVQKSAKQLSLG